MTVPLSDAVEQVKVILGGLSHGLGLLRCVASVAQGWVEARLVRDIFDGANFLTGIHVGEGTSHHTAAIGHFAVRPVDVPVEATRSVGELVRMRWWRRRRRYLFVVREVGDIAKGHAE